MKLIWHNFALFMFCYITIAIIYSKLLLTEGYETSRKQFELLCIYCSRFRILIPIHFLVGFYVSEVIKRYWDQFLTLPYPDRLALKLVSYVPGKVSLSQCLKITEKVAFNIASEASYVYILSIADISLELLSFTEHK